MRPSPSDSLREGAAQHPDRLAVDDGTVRLSYAALDAAVDAATRKLTQEGVAPGERVGLLLGNSVRFVAAYLAVLRAEATVVPFDPTSVPDRPTLRDADLRLLLAEPPLAAELTRVAEGILSPAPALRFGDVVPGLAAVMRGEPELSPCATGDEPDRRAPLHERHDGASEGGDAQPREPHRNSRDGHRSRRPHECRPPRSARPALSPVCTPRGRPGPPRGSVAHPVRQPHVPRPGAAAPRARAGHRGLWRAERPHDPRRHALRRAVSRLGALAPHPHARHRSHAAGPSRAPPRRPPRRPA